jgi:hypothetical protein
MGCQWGMAGAWNGKARFGLARDRGSRRGAGWPVSSPTDAKSLGSFFRFFTPLSTKRQEGASGRKVLGEHELQTQDFFPLLLRGLVSRRGRVVWLLSWSTTAADFQFSSDLAHLCCGLATRRRGLFVAHHHALWGLGCRDLNLGHAGGALWLWDVGGGLTQRREAQRTDKRLSNRGENTDSR